MNKIKKYRYEFLAIVLLILMLILTKEYVGLGMVLFVFFAYGVITQMPFYKKNSKAFK